MELILNDNPYVSERTALFATFVASGEEKAQVTLPFNLKLFLVACLAEYVQDPSITHRVLALDYLDASKEMGATRTLRLKRAGDSSLLLAGLFPERALRLNVSSQYFKHMGQGFYASLAVHLTVSSLDKQGALYNEVAQAFAVLAKVLRDARRNPENEWEAFLRFRTNIE
jgi:hypothetical protein